MKKIYRRDMPPRAAIFYVGDDELTKIFISQKKKVAEGMGIVLDVKHYPHTPLFQEFATDLRRTANSKNYHAVIIQRPLPPELSSPTLENFIPIIKEVEGQKHKSPFFPPVGLATLSILKYIYTGEREWKIKPKDADFFKRSFKKKFIVLAGRGKTTGQPIANTLVRFKMAMVITHSHTPSPEVFYRQADIIITTTGQPIIGTETIKEGAVLINFGYRRENGKTYGDYSGHDIKNKAAYYTPVINGTGPVMLSYLMRNIVEAYARQLK